MTGRDHSELKQSERGELLLANQAKRTASHRGSQRRAEGKALRTKVPRSSQAGFQPRPDRPDPITLLIGQGESRLTELLPIRYGRMVASPFAFYRGAALVMADDLSGTPTTGAYVQACGDAHLANFGAFGTAERTLIFDVNDFDETYPAPWEWDVKRLTASAVLAGREIGSNEAGREAARAAVYGYRTGCLTFAQFTVMERWSTVVSAAQLLKQLGTTKAQRRKVEEHAARHTNLGEMPKLTTLVGDQRQIKESPPLVVRLAAPDLVEAAHMAMAGYRATLSDDLRVLLDRFEYVDAALKVVGVGSVGTRAFVVLFLSADGDPLFLQVKEAVASVLSAYAGGTTYAHQGQRVVVGQRLIQAAGDPLLGWTQGPEGRFFYVRQLRDMKLSIDLATLQPSSLIAYAEQCGRILARAHARTGDPILLAAYLGRGVEFDEAIVSFATDYADQTERDHEALVAAIQQGRVPATTGI